MTTPAEPAAPGGIPAGWKLPRLRITRDGEWLHEGEEVTHPGILANLRENLKVDAEGHYLVAGPARVPVELEDAPFVVLRVAAEGDRLVATLNDLSREPLDPETLSFDGAGVPHCRVKGGTFSARLSRAATYQLLERMEDEGDDEPGGAGGRLPPLSHRAAAAGHAARPLLAPDDPAAARTSMRAVAASDRDQAFWKRWTPSPPTRRAACPSASR